MYFLVVIVYCIVSLTLSIGLDHKPTKTVFFSPSEAEKSASFKPKR
jgi:hypothetical protein